VSDSIETTAVVVRENCVPWKFGKNGNGYGCANVGHGRKNRRVVLAHRMMFELYVGPIKDGLFVMHKCDNPICVNPNHLFQGTPKDNSIDAWKKGRLVILPPVRGEQNPRCKLTEIQVRQIREMYSAGHFLQRDIAKQFGIAQITVSNIVTRKSWRHL